MNKFRVKAGKHYEGEEVFLKDDTFESSTNWAKMFPDKYENQGVATAVATKAKVQAAKDDDDEDDDEDDDDEETSLLGENVTEEFPEAKENGLVVYKKDGKFFLADGDEPEVLLDKKGVAKRTIEERIAKFSN